MQSEEIFISKSIDLHLFFMRITQEHLLFIESALPSKNKSLKQEAQQLRQELLKIFSYIISISNGYISQNVINSGELITKYTYEAEKLSEYYTGIEIDSNYTLRENNILISQESKKQISNDEISEMNNYIISIVNKVTDFQSKILESVLNCKLYTSIFPERLDHIIVENKHYIYEIEKIQKKDLVVTFNELNEEMIFWNENLSDHGIYTALRLDPTEKILANKSMDFSDEYNMLEKEAKINQEENISNLINRSIEETIKYQEANINGIEGLLYCKLKSIILPLEAEHDLRELNHYLRILEEGKKYLNI